MRKLLLTTLVTASCFFTRLHSQLSAGISGGYTNNEFYTNISNYDYSYYKKEGGFVVAAPVRYGITNWFAVQAEPGFIQKSFSLWQTQQTAEPTHLTNRFNFLQLPVKAHFSFGSHKWNGFLHLGGYGSYWLSGRIKGTVADNYNSPYYPPVILFLTQNVNGKYEFDKRRDRRLQYGWLAGIGLQYAIIKKLDLFAEGRYIEDLTDQQKKHMRNQIPRYNITTSVSAGCLYRFSMKKHT